MLGASGAGNPWFIARPISWDAALVEQHSVLLNAIFLIPVTLFMHRFWGLGDLQMAHAQQVNFLKNLGLLGAAIYIIFAGAGSYSFDAKAGRDGALQAPGHW